MANFSLEEAPFMFDQGINFDDEPDPFAVLTQHDNTNSSIVSVEAHYSDISDAEDFDIPSSQVPRPDRYV